MGPLCWWPALLVRALDRHKRRVASDERRGRVVTSFTSAQVINLCGPEKQVQSVDYLLPWLLHLPALLSALKCKIGPNSGLRHQHWGCEAADIVIAV